MPVFKILNELNSYKLGFHKRDRMGMNLLCGYHYISAEKNNELKKKGGVLFQVLNKLNDIYKDAIAKNDKDFLRLLETGILRSPKMGALHRKQFLNGQQQLPLLFRGDSTDLNQFIDFQVGLRGLGYVHALKKVMSKYLKREPLHDFMRLNELLNIFVNNLKANAHRITFYPMPWNPPEIDYLLKEVFLEKPARAGSLPNVLFDSEQSNGSVTRQLYVAPRDFYKQLIGGLPFLRNAWLRRFFLNFCYDTVEKYGRKELEAEPPPNLLLEQKSILALVREERFKDHFTREEKEIFPETYIIKRGLKMQFGPKGYTLQDIVDMPRLSRSYIIKYAGLDFKINWGGRAVYRIKNISKIGAANIIKKAILSYEKYKEPWILQKEVSCKEDVEYLDTETKLIKTENLYKLYRPYFLYMPDKNEIELLDTMVLFRNNFKVHAKEDCVIGLASPRE